MTSLNLRKAATKGGRMTEWETRQFVQSLNAFMLPKSTMKLAQKTTMCTPAQGLCMQMINTRKSR
eukprot:9572786-Karenia_brevis.AAC.1